MAGLASIASAALGIAQPALGLYQSYQTMQYQRAQQEYQQRWQIWQQQQADRQARLQEQRLTAAENQDIGRMRAAVGESAEVRRQALRRAVARKRARLGARGIGSTTGGSGEALLLGLVDDAAIAQAAENRDLKSRIDSIIADRHYRRRLNLLDRRHPGPVGPVRPTPGIADVVVGGLDGIAGLTGGGRR
ncbi:MAG: hypothetical protein GVY28_12930 [Alphaproteobacteria bacterium]|jgi:hypothetical protein|nr:hypothetical protein [Alphaproteobacteria bacterium]